MLNASIERMWEITENTLEEKRDDKGKLLQLEEKADSGTSAYKKIVIRAQFNFENYVRNYQNISEIKDIKVTDCFYTDARNLIERLHLDFANKNGLMHPTEPINLVDVKKIIQYIFFYNDLKINNYSKGKMTKGEADIMMSDVLDYYYNEIMTYARVGEAKEVAIKKATDEEDEDSYSLEQLNSNVKNYNVETTNKVVAIKKNSKEPQK